MKFLLSLISILLLAPTMCAAEIVINNSGSVSSYTSSSASTGGNVVEGSGTVVTGNASASSKSEVTSGSDGGSVYIETSTEVNGETKTQVVEKTLNKGEPVSVEVNSKAVAGQKPESSIKINGAEQNPDAVATVTSETISRTQSPTSNILFSLGTRISTAIKNFFSVLKFW